MKSAATTAPLSEAGVLVLILPLVLGRWVEDDRPGELPVVQERGVTKLPVVKCSGAAW